MAARRTDIDRTGMVENGYASATGIAADAAGVVAEPGDFMEALGAHRHWDRGPGN